MGYPLADHSAVETLLPQSMWPSGVTPDAVDQQCAFASALLRQRAPSVDARLNLPAADKMSLDPDVVALVVAGAVKRFLVNVTGATSTSSSITAGPMSKQQSYGFTSRDDGSSTGSIVITDADLASLRPYSASRSTVGTVKVRPGLAPWPLGTVNDPGVLGFDDV